MFTAIIMGFWKFLTSKLGIFLLLTALCVGALWGIYNAGQRSERAEAQATVKKGAEAADKKVAGIQAKIDQLLAERKAWRESMDATIEKAKAGQAEVIAGLKSDLDKAEKRTAKTKVVIKEVPKYVTVKADNQCVVPRGFVWLYDYALQAGAVSGSGPTDVDAASGVALSTVASVAASNNSECAERGQLLNAWQEWYKKNADIHRSISESANSR